LVDRLGAHHAIVGLAGAQGGCGDRGVALGDQLDDPVSEPAVGGEHSGLGAAPTGQRSVTRSGSPGISVK